MTGRRRLVLSIVLLLLLTGIGMAFFLRETVRQLVVLPLLYVLWVVRLFLRSIHQVVYWLVLLVVVLALAIRSLIGRWGGAREAPLLSVVYRGRVGMWARWVDLAQQRYYYRGYFKWRLARQLGELTQNVLAYRDRIDPREVRQALDAGKLDLPPELQAYLGAGLWTRSFSAFRQWRQRFSRRREPSPLDVDPMCVVEYLEEQMEG